MAKTNPQARVPGWPQSDGELRRYATETLRETFDRYRAGEVSGDQMMENLTRFSETWRRDRICLAWPPGYGLVIGAPSMFGLSDQFSEVVRRFGKLFKQPWVVFMGLASHESRREQTNADVWILATACGEVCVYEPEEQHLYSAASDMIVFLDVGLRNVDTFYTRPYVDNLLEARWYGHDPTGRRERALSLSSGSEVLEFAGRNCGLTFENYEDEQEIILDVDPGSELPGRVRTAVAAAGYSFIARCSKFSRFALIEPRTGHIYVLLSGGFVMRVALSFPAFLRMRLRALEYGQSRRAISDSGSNTCPVGEQLSFPCPMRYSLPGDADLLRCWARQHVNGQGWP